MANLNNKIRGKKLFKEGGSGAIASKGSDGEITVSKEKSDDLASLSDISELFNDNALYTSNRHLLKQTEDLREDVEELHTYIKDAFGSDSSAAASKGGKGDTGNTGSAGGKGDKGDKGDTGSTGSAGSAGGKGDKGDTGSTGSAGAKGST